MQEQLRAHIASQEEGRENTGGDRRSLKPQANPQGHTSYNKVMPPPSQTVPPSGETSIQMPKIIRGHLIQGVPDGLLQKDSKG